MIIYDFLYNLIFNLTQSAVLSNIIAMIISAALPLIFVLTFVLWAVLAERKVSAWMQDRVGPNRTGPHGILQTVADLVKLLQKEDIIASENDKPLFNIAPVLVFSGAYMAFAIIPFSFGYIGSNIDLGLIFFVAASGFVTAGILMAGWASNNKYSLLGAMRSAAQIISYEIPTLLVLVTIIMITGTTNLRTLSEMQTGHFLNWMIFGGPGLSAAKFLFIPFMFIGFIILYISTLAEVNRTPFDIPEAESELVSGFHTEYSGMKFAMFFLSEYANMFAVSALVSAVFLGGYQSPIGYLGNLFHLTWLVPIEQFFWFAFKGIFFVLVQMWLRWTLPRLRVDQLMALCWKYLIPIAFANLIIVGLITVL